MSKKTAIVLGATGLTGGYVLDILLNDDEFSKVKVFTRNSTNIKHPKLEEIICDLLQLEEYENEFYANVVFCCIGTTKSKTPDKEKYRAIDFGIPVTSANLAVKNGVETFSVISALSADSNSSIFYNKIKGEMEDAILGLPIDNIFIYRPSLIYGDRKDNRILEKIGVGFAKVVDPLLIGKLRKYKALHAKDLAKSMVHSAKSLVGTHIILRDEIN